MILVKGRALARTYGAHDNSSKRLSIFLAKLAKSPHTTTANHAFATLLCKTFYQKTTAIEVESFATAGRALASHPY